VRTATTAVEAIARLAERGADLVFVDGPMTRPDPVGFVRRAMAYSPQATLVMYGLPEPSVASALIAAGARGVIRGGDTDLVTAVTKTVLLLGLTDSVEIGTVVGALAGAASAGAVSAGAPRVNGARRVATADVALASSDAARPVLRPTATGKINGTSERVSANDTRNGGPGYATPRPAGADQIDHVVRPSEPDLRGLPSALVPQQRMDFPPRANGARTPSLTERELQVLRGMSDGMSNAEIGRELFVSEDTVKTHARRLFRKLGARDRAHAVASGFRLGLVG